jgi:PAS domain-containing protein
MTETPELDYDSLVNRLAQEVAQAQRQLGAAQQKLLSTVRSLETRTQELTEAKAALSLVLATFDASGEGALAVGPFGRSIHFNTRFAEIWGIPAGKVACLNDAALLALQMAQLKDPERFLEISQAPRTQPGDARCDVVELTDGRMIECRLEPQTVRGRRIGSVTRYRDVTGTHPTPA